MVEHTGNAVNAEATLAGRPSVAFDSLMDGEGSVV